MKEERKVLLYLVAVALVIAAGIILYNFWSSPEYTPVTIENYVEQSSRQEQKREANSIEESFYKNETKIEEKATVKENEVSKADTSVLSGTVNINSATKEQFMLLSGIGEVKAQAILDYRNENGRFNSVEELLNVTGIGEKTLEKIKSNITVD